MLQDALEKMSPEERQSYIIQTSRQERQHQELMKALHAQDEQLAQIVSKTKDQNWLTSFTSDVLANFTSAGILWLGSKVLKKL